MGNSTLTAALVKELMGYESPYSEIGDVIYAQGIKNQYPYRMSTGEAIGTGLAQGLSAGLFQAYGKSKEDERNKMIADALAGGLTDDAVGQLAANPETRDAANSLAVVLAEQEREQKQLYDELRLKSAMKGDTFKTIPSGPDQKITYRQTAPTIDAEGNIIPGEMVEFARGTTTRGSGLGASLDRPLSQAQRDFYNSLGYEIPEGLSQRDAALGAEITGRSNVQNRFEEGMGLKKDQLEIPGYEYVGEVRPTAPEAKEIRTQLGEAAKLKSTLGMLAENVDENGFLNAFGNNAALQGALYSFVFRGGRGVSGTGANLTGNEKSLVALITPPVLEGDFTGAIKAGLTGRNPAELARDLIGIVDKVEQADVYARVQAVPVGKSDAFGSEQGAAGFNKEAYKEQYKAKRRKELGLAP